MNGGQIPVHVPLQFDTPVPSALKTYSVIPLGVAKPGDPKIVCVIAGEEDAGAGLPFPGAGAM
jgi:hypothetical protein